MTNESILGKSKLVAFAATSDFARARAFYEGVLGLSMAEDESPFALVFDANGTMLRVTHVGKHTPVPFTVLGWDVESIDAIAQKLADAGVPLLRFPGVNDVTPSAIWDAPSGARIAWFHDPDCNVLSVTEFAQSAE
ncbi:VOC family protein [Terracidiphilus sp.]|uniref:VOC family protein n=1 Tax=Terracidiphilus sp. TaxID=1964191 RepID=UPI003C279DF0